MAAESSGESLTAAAMGYFRSRALCAAARLGVADALGLGERCAEELAAACRADPAALRRLLRALASFGVAAETRPGFFRLTERGRPLRKDDPRSEWAAVVFWADLLADDWRRLGECVRQGKPAREARPAGEAGRWAEDPEAPQIFRAVMGTAPAENYMPIVRAWDFSRYRTIADLGCGGGALAAAILQACPHARAMLVDRPEAVEKASSRLAAEGLEARCDFRAADLLERIPSGADAHVLKSVLHGYADEQAAAILRRCRDALPAGGRLLLVESVLPEVIDRPDADLEHRLMSDLNMLVATGGRERTETEWKGLLREAGFDYLSSIDAAPHPAAIIEAAPAAGGGKPRQDTMQP